MIFLYFFIFFQLKKKSLFVFSTDSHLKKKMNCYFGCCASFCKRKKNDKWGTVPVSESSYKGLLSIYLFFFNIFNFGMFDNSRHQSIKKNKMCFTSPPLQRKNLGLKSIPHGKKNNKGLYIYLYVCVYYKNLILFKKNIKIGYKLELVSINQGKNFICFCLK
ncbi:hypothetical protein RFI_03837 [Reticulomyxa filosa]|uniref:Uncharacterized protein n=1 Tax=Reticulomyxa filosa TaxID=46433 RepID=X6P5A3_RETFI|nr:hypothetical protein RFI_03837 [Reticulomyxa filosa]|eukprot:ETO33269.1 hypothetical protein RFI_03837 [Reticulomyxa filosa]